MRNKVFLDRRTYLIFPKVLSPHPFWIGKEKFLGNKINEMHSFLAFVTQQKVQCVTWYHDVSSTSQMKPRYFTACSDRTSGLHDILLWVGFFNEHGGVDSRSWTKKPSTNGFWLSGSNWKWTKRFSFISTDHLPYLYGEHHLVYYYVAVFSM